MDVESARLAYAPFRKFPNGHVFIVFRFINGEEIGISPEADLKPGMTYSPLRGMRKTYQLRYVAMPLSSFLYRYAQAGRHVREYPLDLPSEDLKKLYTKMIDRTAVLEQRFEWYHTLFNSCVSNVTQHLEDIQGKRSIFVKVILAIMPAHLRRIW